MGLEVFVDLFLFVGCKCLQLLTFGDFWFKRSEHFNMFLNAQRLEPAIRTQSPAGLFVWSWSLETSEGQKGQ